MSEWVCERLEQNLHTHFYTHALCKCKCDFIRLYSSMKTYLSSEKIMMASFKCVFRRFSCVRLCVCVSQISQTSFNLNLLQYQSVVAGGSIRHLKRSHRTAPVCCFFKLLSDICCGYNVTSDLLASYVMLAPVCSLIAIINNCINLGVTLSDHFFLSGKKSIFVYISHFLSRYFTTNGTIL